MELFVLGLIFEIVGVFILTLASSFRHQTIYPNHRIFGEPPNKIYWWTGWNPLFKVYPSKEKSRWMLKPKHKIVRYGIIPLKYQWNIIGFLFILGGAWSQIRFFYG